MSFKTPKLLDNRVMTLPFPGLRQHSFILFYFYFIFIHSEHAQLYMVTEYQKTEEKTIYFLSKKNCFLEINLKRAA
jgi:hypothetical protein